jgi:hypothetical protein
VADEATRLEFAEKIRALYLEHFGGDAFQGTDNDEPAALGAVLLLMEGEHLDGRTSLHTFHASSYTTCKGMAWRFLNDDFRVEDADD